MLSTVERWLEEGHRFALATVTQTWGSSPRPVGAVMAIREDGAVAGSVSGGCVESAVMQESIAALGSGRPKLLDFGALSDESVWEVGLSCGGRIQVWVDPDPIQRGVWPLAFQNLRENRPSVVVTRLASGDQWLWESDGEFDGPKELASHAADALQLRVSREVEVEGQGYFLHVLPRRDRMIVVGGVHIAIPLVRFAGELGFETVVIDPRPHLVSEDRFPEADRLIATWPGQALETLQVDESTYAVVLTHDPKIDDVALEMLLRGRAAYIGALGSRVTQEKRRTALRKLGFGDDDLARIHGPVGLDIGARSPEEIAISIVAEIVQVRNARR